MASPKLKTSPQDNLLSCPICMDTYKTPRMLPCQHTLCESCLHSYIVNKSKERVLVSDFPCPVCRASTQAPRAFTRIDTWSTLFPLNHLLVSLLDSNFQEMMEKSEVGFEKCVEHAGKMIEFFCTEHKQKVCSKCFKNSHRQCDIIDIEDHVEFTSRFNTVKCDVDNVNSYLNHVITHLRSNIDQLALQKTAILSEVKDFRGKVEALLHSFETDIRDHVSVQHDGEVVVLKALCEKYERLKAEIEASENTLNQLPISGNISQSLESISSIENEIKSHVSFLNGCHSNIKLTKLEFAIECELIAFLNNFGQIGNVQVNYFDANIKSPPDLLPRDTTQSECFMPSSNELCTSSPNEQSPKNTRQRSPRAIICARPSVSTTSQMTVNQQCRTPPRSHKEPKRPLTVPIESTAPTPIVRPRPERPDMRCIQHFLPRAFSSPVQDKNNGDRATGNFRDSVAQTDIEHSNDHAQTQDQMQTVTSQDSPLSPLSPTNQDSSKVSVQSSNHSIMQERRHSHGGRVWQHVSVKSDAVDSPGPADALVSSEVSESPIGLRIRHRIGSMSDATSGNSSDQNVVSRIVRNFQEHPKQKSSDGSPLYENTPAGHGVMTYASANRKNVDRKVEFLHHVDNSSKRCYKLSEACIRIQSDAQECTITCSAEMPDKRLILIDCNNSRVKLFSKKIEYIAHVDMPMEPWNVACTNNDEIAVTIPLGKAINIIRLHEGSLDISRRIETRRECWGICFVDGKLVITTKDDGNLVVFLDKNGRELQIVNFASRENGHILRPVSISTRCHDNIMYISCEGQSGTKGSVAKMSATGDVVQVFTYRDLDRPYSTTTDERNNVYVAALRSANVTFISEAGGNAETLLSRDTGMIRPQHIQLISREGSTVLLLSERRSDQVVLYEVK